MFISRMVISLSWSWGFTVIPSTGLCYGKFPWIKLASVGAGLGKLSLAFVEQRFEYLGGRRFQGLLLAQPPSALGAVASAGARLSGDGLCLILTLILELLGASVDLTSARPVSSGSAVNFREQLRSGSSSCCVWPYKPPCCCNVRGDDLLLFLLPLFYPSPAAVQIILLGSAEELLLSGLEMPSKLRKWKKGHIQLLLTWKQIFGTAASWVAVWYWLWIQPPSGASHIPLGFIFKLKFQSLFSPCTHKQEYPLLPGLQLWGSSIQVVKRNLMRRSNSSPHLAFKLSGFRFGKHNILLLKL